MAADEGSTVPTPDGAIEVIVERLLARAEPVTRAMVERYREEVADYRLADEQFVRGDVQHVTYVNYVGAVRSFTGDRGPQHEAAERTRAGAANRVVQGISLESFLHVTRLFGQALWEAVLEVTDPSVPTEREAALTIAADVMRHVDEVSGAAAEGYLQEVQSLWTDSEVVRRDMLEDLLSGRGDSPRVRGIAQSLGVPLADSYVAVVARGPATFVEERPDQPLPARVALRRIVEGARRHLRPDVGSVLVGMRQGEVVALYPVASAKDVQHVKRDATALTAALSGQHVCVAIGGSYPGRPGVAESYAEAKEALEIARSTETYDRPVAFDEVLIDHALRSVSHGDRIIDHTLRPLIDYDARRHAELVPTLRAYVECGLNLTRAAQFLDVHPNTVVYRLRRIRELSGHDPQVAADLLPLLLGLKLHELRA